MPGPHPQIVCPGCERTPVKVAPQSQRIYPHNRRDERVRCDWAGKRIDLYDLDPADVTPNP